MTIMTEFATLSGAIFAAAAPLGAIWLYFDKKIERLMHKVQACESERELSKDHLLVTGVITSMLISQMQNIAPNDPVLRMAQERVSRMFPHAPDAPRELSMLLDALDRLKEREAL